MDLFVLITLGIFVRAQTTPPPPTGSKSDHMEQLSEETHDINVNIDFPDWFTEVPEKETSSERAQQTKPDYSDRFGNGSIDIESIMSMIKLQPSERQKYRKRSTSSTDTFGEFYSQRHQQGEKEMWANIIQDISSTISSSSIEELFPEDPDQVDVEESEETDKSDTDNRNSSSVKKTHTKGFRSWQGKYRTKKNKTSSLAKKIKHSEGSRNIRVRLKNLGKKRQQSRRIPNESEELTPGDLEEVYYALFEARMHWYDIGMALGIPSVTLNSIATDNENVEARYSTMLLTWLQHGRDRYWKALASALRKKHVRRSDIAKKVENKYMYRDFIDRIISDEPDEADKEDHEPSTTEVKQHVRAPWSAKRIHRSKVKKRHHKKDKTRDSSSNEDSSDPTSLPHSGSSNKTVQLKNKEKKRHHNQDSTIAIDRQKSKGSSSKKKRKHSKALLMTSATLYQYNMFITFSIVLNIF